MVTLDSCLCSQTGMQDHVDARDVVSGNVGFLAVQLQLAHVTAMLLDIADALQQKATRTTGPVANGHASVGLQHLDHQEADLGRGVELPAGFAGLAGEVSDQVFVGVTEQVVRDVCAVKGLTAEVVDQVDQLVARQLVLLVEVDFAGEDAVEVVLAVGVGSFDGEHGVIQRLAELGLGGAVMARGSAAGSGRQSRASERRIDTT